MNTLKTKIFFVCFILLIWILLFYLDLNRYFNPDFFINKKQELDSLYKNHPVLFILIFFCVYVLCTTLSIPGAAVLTLSAGFLFDFFIGSVLVSLGSTTGATLAFLISRFLLKDFVQKKFHSRLKIINKGFKKDGFLYLLSLRLIPIFPFFLINLLMGLTTISTKQFIIVSCLGMLPGTFVYVNAGKQLSSVQSMSDILSVPIILSFCILAGLPWIMKLFFKLFVLKKNKLK